MVDTVRHKSSKKGVDHSQGGHCLDWILVESGRGRWETRHVTKRMMHVDILELNGKNNNILSKRSSITRYTSAIIVILPIAAPKEHSTVDMTHMPPEFPG